MRCLCWGKLKTLWKKDTKFVPISVYKISKIATYINEVVIYGEMRSGEDMDVMSLLPVGEGISC